jgi:hypothetical protein
MEVLESVKTCFGVLIDAETRTVRKVRLNYGDDGDGVHDYDSDQREAPNFLPSIEYVFILSKDESHSEILMCLDQFHPSVEGSRYRNGFLAWWNDEKVIIAGNGYITRDLWISEYKAINVNTQFDPENIVEGTGPIPGKLVIQWI